MAQPLTSNPAPCPVVGGLGTPVPATNGPMNPTAATDRIRNLSQLFMAQPISPYSDPRQVAEMSASLIPNAASHAFGEQLPALPYLVARIAKSNCPRVSEGVLLNKMVKLEDFGKGVASSLSVPVGVTPAFVILDAIRASQSPGVKLYARC